MEKTKFDAQIEKDAAKFAGIIMEFVVLFASVILGLQCAAAIQTINGAELEITSGFGVLGFTIAIFLYGVIKTRMAQAEILKKLNNEK